MKNKLPTILLTLSLTTLFGFFNYGDEIELDGFLNARTHPDFLRETQNIKTTLPKGTTGKVTEIKNFITGNAGVKITVSSGAYAGKSYWVYYNKKNPALKLVDQKARKDVTDKFLNKMIKDATTLPEKWSPIVKKPVQPFSVVPVEIQIKKQPIANPISKTPASVEADKTTPIAEGAAIIPPTPPEVAESTLDLPPDTMIQESASQKIHEEITAEVLRDIDASRDIEEYMIEVAAKKAANINAKSVSEAITPNVDDNCNTAEVEIVPNEDVYSPQSALADLNSEDLKFISRMKMAGREKNSSCIFENAKVYVIYDHCMSNKAEIKEASVMQIISKAGGTVQFSYQNVTGKQITDLDRSDYKGSWSIAYTPTRPTGKLNTSALRYFESEINKSNQACYVGNAHGAQKLDSKATCFGELNPKTSDWAPKAEQFWVNPPAEWYSTQKKLRDLIQKAPF